MENQKTPKEVINSTTDEIQKAINQILIIERKYKHNKNITNDLKNNISKQIHHIIVEGTNK